MLERYLTEPGDSIGIFIFKDSTYTIRRTISSATYNLPVYNYSQYKMIFKGNGSEKYQCRYDIDRIVAADTTRLTAVNKKGELIYAIDHCDSSELICQRILNHYKPEIGKDVYAILKIDFFSAFETERVASLYASFRIRNGDSAFLKNLIKEYENKLVLNKVLSAPQSEWNISTRFCQYTVAKSLLEMLLYGPAAIYEKLKNKFKKELKDKLLTTYLLQASLKSNIQNVMLDDALANIKTIYCRQELNEFADNNWIGRPVKDFSLSDTSGNIIHLHDFTGKVVLIDFWFTGCTNCVGYYKNVIAATEEHFKEDSNVVFLTINVDIDKSSWLSSLYSGNYASLKSINLNTQGLGTDHSIFKNLRISLYPSPLLIDRKGKIFSNNNNNELRAGGTDRLIKIINRALAAE